MSKTIKTVIIVEVTDELFAEKGLTMLNEVNDGTFKEDLFDEDAKEEGVLNVTVTAELLD